jgi:hypothetical protein
LCRRNNKLHVRSISVEAKLRIFSPKFPTVYQRQSMPNFPLLPMGYAARILK